MVQTEFLIFLELLMFVLFKKKITSQEYTCLPSNYVSFKSYNSLISSILLSFSLNYLMKVAIPFYFFVAFTNELCRGAQTTERCRKRSCERFSLFHMKRLILAICFGECLDGVAEAKVWVYWNVGEAELEWRLMRFFFFKTVPLSEPAAQKEKTVWATTRFHLIVVRNPDFFHFSSFSHAVSFSHYDTPTILACSFLLSMPVCRSVGVFFCPEKKVNSCAAEKQAICPGLFG